MTAVRDSGSARDLWALVLIVSVSAVLAHGYLNRVDRRHLAARLALQARIIDGTAPAPYRYRVLVPFATEGLTRALTVRLPPEKSFELAYALYDFLAVFFLLAMLFWWSRTWFTREQALVGVLFVAATMPIALQNHYFQPWSLLEPPLVTAALLAMHRRRYWLVAGVSVLAALNKETAILIPLAFLLTMDPAGPTSTPRLPEWRPIVLLAGLLIAWAGVFGGLRYGLGHSSLVSRIPGIFERNLLPANLMLTAVHASLFLGGLWIFAVAGIRHAPPFIRRVAPIVPIYLLFVAVWGVWYEVRVLMSLYPVLVPLGLSFLYLRDGRSPGARP
jgi:hypothetical protein